MGIDGMSDRMMLIIIWESPLGSAATLRVLGALLVLMSVLAVPSHPSSHLLARF